MQILKPVLHFGLLLFPEFQWLDAVGPADYINSHSHQYASLIPDIAPDVLDKAPHIKWHYISSDLTPVKPTAGPLITPDVTYDTCPPLDYLIVPGPVPLLQTVPDGLTAFLENLLADDKFKALLMICVGSLTIAQTGLLDGRNVCSNKTVLKSLALSGQLDPRVKWVGDRRWVVDGKLWSSAGITAGLDLAAEFARVHFDPDLVALVRESSEYAPNPDQPDKFAYILDGVTLP
ncbi:hypothetical protein D9619_013412 [Psilocybe cf. subviscida]|uniref:DJ-1/PfpI domain-containing protein n=1 Tax=Psilocybe cf. subviscida TaxID=2480587 RepID=A0A8H5F906_9AGAR|nr:hypothetical protein D9619_013412 [Psilocybe cf. subviscida]